MPDPITPPEAVEAAWHAYQREVGRNPEMLGPMRAALRAALDLVDDEKANKAGGLWYRRWRKAQDELAEFRASHLTTGDQDDREIDLAIKALQMSHDDETRQRGYEIGAYVDGLRKTLQSAADQPADCQSSAPNDAGNSGNSTAGDQGEFPRGTKVRFKSNTGPQWEGEVVGHYSSTFTADGLVVECDAEGAKGIVHVDPAKRFEVRAAPPAGEWQPIETAPKDGSRFLAWGGVFNNLPYVLAWEPTEFNAQMPWKVVQTAGRVYEHVPQAWQPLPKAPLYAGRTA